MPSMKIRNPLFIKIVGTIGALLVRVWIGSVRYRYRPQGKSVDPTRMKGEGRYIYAFWHEYLLLPACHYGQRNVWVLISEHADGELITQACRNLGFCVVRGSTTRGGSRALQQLVKVAEKGHLALTPDGPRGPRRQVQMGLVYLAARTGWPIIPIGFAAKNAWRMKSWDCFMLPVPYGSAYCVTGEPIRVPDNADRMELEVYRERVQQAMDAANEDAESLVRRERGKGEARQERQAA
jgi:lysophospholipid acyltransferase (LPLAT)-like uncharacterized protein